MRRLSSRARRYMLTYLLLDSSESNKGHGLLYHEKSNTWIKKVRRNTAGQESAFIAQAWQELQKSGEKADISK